MTHLLPFLWSALKAFFLCFGVATFFVLTWRHFWDMTWAGQAISTFLCLLALPLIMPPLALYSFLTRNNPNNFDPPWSGKEPWVRLTDGSATSEIVVQNDD